MRLIAESWLAFTARADLPFFCALFGSTAAADSTDSIFFAAVTGLTDLVDLRACAAFDTAAVFTALVGFLALAALVGMAGFFAAADLVGFFAAVVLFGFFAAVVLFGFFAAEVLVGLVAAVALLRFAGVAIDFRAAELTGAFALLAAPADLATRTFLAELPALDPLALLTDLLARVVERADLVVFGFLASPR